MAVHGFKNNKCKEEVIPKKVITKSLSAAGWYRVAKLQSTRGSFIADINTSYNANSNMTTTLLIDLAYLKAKITQLGSIVNIKGISKARVTMEKTEPENEYYLEIYYDLSSRNAVNIGMINLENACTVLNFETPTNTATVLDELHLGETTITNNNGTATKFPDGTMMCRTTVPKEKFKNSSSYSTVAQGINIYRSNVFDWTFPVEFIDTDIQIELSVSNNAGGCRFCFPRVNGGINKRNAQIQLLGFEDFTENALGYTTLNEVYVTAVGRWKTDN